MTSSSSRADHVEDHSDRAPPAQALASSVWAAYGGDRQAAAAALREAAALLSADE